jgi:hypothetical protein
MDGFPNDVSPFLMCLLSQIFFRFQLKINKNLQYYSKNRYSIMKYPGSKKTQKFRYIIAKFARSCGNFQKMMKNLISKKKRDFLKMILP